jgi:hypothetical protein
MSDEIQNTTANPPTQRSIWVVVAVSALTSLSVWGMAELIQAQLKPEPPPPTTTERILDGIGEAWGAASSIDKDDMETVAGLANLLGGGSEDPMGDLQDAMKLAEMALGTLGQMEDLGSLSEGLEGFGDLDKMMGEAMQQLGGLDLGELGLGDLDLGDLGGLLGGGDAPSIPEAGWELSSEMEDFRGLEALDKLLEGQ